MALKRYARFSVLALLNTLCFFLILAAIFIGYRIVTYEQSELQPQLEGKRAYLQQLSEEVASQHKDSGAVRPNIIFVLYDDLGMGDIGVAAPNPDLIKTPNLDRLADEGISLTDFYSPAPVCTPARAGYLTGRIPARAGLPYVVFPTDTAEEMFLGRVLNPNANRRLPAEEITLPEILHSAGYATAMVGKWHIGDRSPSLPNDFGFDQFFGSLYSNDMKPFELYRNTQREVPDPVDQRYLSERYSKEVTRIIESSTEQPFFLYLAHNFPHEPLAVRDERLGKSNAGLYGDVIEELDDGIGEIFNALERTGKLDNTLIIVTSDNGPWFLGSSAALRGRKGNTFEGGMRVPFIAHWPAEIAGNRIDTTMASGVDLVPTVLDLLNLPAPQDRMLDGRSMLPLLTHQPYQTAHQAISQTAHQAIAHQAIEENQMPQKSGASHQYLYFYDGERLFSVRDQRFKYRGPASIKYGTDEMPMWVGVPQEEWLFDLQDDPYETYDVSARYPEVLTRLRQVFEDKQEEMTNNPRGWK